MDTIGHIIVWWCGLLSHLRPYLGELLSIMCLGETNDSNIWCSRPSSLLVSLRDIITESFRLWVKSRIMNTPISGYLALALVLMVIIGVTISVMVVWTSGLSPTILGGIIVHHVTPTALWTFRCSHSGSWVMRHYLAMVWVLMHQLDAYDTYDENLFIRLATMCLSGATMVAVYMFIHVIICMYMYYLKNISELRLSSRRFSIILLCQTASKIDWKDLGD